MISTTIDTNAYEECESSLLIVDQWSIGARYVKEILLEQDLKVFFVHFNSVLPEAQRTLARDFDSNNSGWMRGKVFDISVFDNSLNVLYQKLMPSDILVISLHSVAARTSADFFSRKGLTVHFIPHGFFRLGGSAYPEKRLTERLRSLSRQGNALTAYYRIFRIWRRSHYEAFLVKPSLRRVLFSLTIACYSPNQWKWRPGRFERNLIRPDFLYVSSDEEQKDYRSRYHDSNARAVVCMPLEASSLAIRSENAELANSKKRHIVIVLPPAGLASVKGMMEIVVALKSCAFGATREILYKKHPNCPKADPVVAKLEEVDVLELSTPLEELVHAIDLTVSYNSTLSLTLSYFNVPAILISRDSDLGADTLIRTVEDNAGALSLNEQLLENSNQHAKIVNFVLALPERKISPEPIAGSVKKNVVNELRIRIERKGC